MDLSFGGRLRQQREQQGIALRAIADQTKIKLALLEALERDDVSQWPSGIFRRSYFRVYAQAIGLDPDAAVREFLERWPDPNGEAAAPEEPRVQGVARRPPIRLRYLIDSAVGVLPALRAQSGMAVERQPSAATAPLPSPTNTAAPRAGRVDFAAVARLCARLARVVDANELTHAAEDAAAALDAVGVILWIWDPRAQALGAALAHGYSEELVRQLPRLAADSEAAIAAAFRSGDTLVVRGTDAATGAVVAPLMAPSGCAGVLAIELPAGVEQHDDARAAAVILAAQLATLVGSPALAQAVSA
jgi:hypothetical protein